MSSSLKITIEEAAAIIHKNPHYVRLLLQHKRVSYGDAVQKSNGRWSYHISPNKFREHEGLTVEELKERLSKIRANKRKIA